MTERPLVLPPRARRTIVPQNCPMDIIRKVERRWEQRKNAAITRNDNDHVACPVCKAAGSFARVNSEYRGRGIMHHHRQCAVCGHEWITVVHVLS